GEERDERTRDHRDLEHQQQEVGQREAPRQVRRRRAAHRLLVSRTAPLWATPRCVATPATHRPRRRPRRSMVAMTYLALDAANVFVAGCCVEHGTPPVSSG